MIGMVPVAPRSIWATDFAEIALAAELENYGWTRGGASTGVGGTDYTTANYWCSANSGALSGRWINMTKLHNSEYRHCRWTALGTMTDFEFLALIRFSTLPSSTGGVGFCRVAGSASSADGYDWTFDGDSLSGETDRYRASKFSNGFLDAAISGTETGISLDTSNEFWVRGRASGTTYSIKAWRRGTAEPSYASGTDATYSSGYFGMQIVDTPAIMIEWLAVAVGTGKTAPGPQG